MPTTPVIESTDVLGPRPTTRPMREPQALTPRMRVRRAITLLIITLVVPGSAQIAAGSRRLGRIGIRIWLAVLAGGLLAGALYLLKRSVLFSLATSPLALTAFAVVLFALALGWPVLFVDAWRLGRPHLLPMRSRIGTTVLALALVAATSLPLLAVGRRVWAGADFLSGVFGSDRTAAASNGRFNVLLMGGDAGPDRVGTRPDSMTLVSIDADTGRAVLFSLPRNLEDVPFARGSAADAAMPQGWSCGDDCLLNGIYTWGSEHRDLFPGEVDPGAAAMKSAAAGITGLEVPYYVLIDLRGFSDLINAMGGIDVTVKQRVPIGGGTSRVSGYIEPGTRHLNGYRALWYARSRHGASDYERMARQRCVMDAMLHQLDPATVLTKFQDIAAAGKNVVSTDIPAGQLDTFLDLAIKAKSGKISSVQFVPPLINPARPDYTVIHRKVNSTIKASEKARPTAASTSSASPGGSVAGPTGGTSSTHSGGGASPSASPAAEASDISTVCQAA